MSALRAQHLAPVLRVAVVASDPERQAFLSRVVRDAGHILVSSEGASVVLADGVAPPHAVPTVVLGAGFNDVQGVVPSDATSEQIDAALRAVAAGLSVKPVLAPDERQFRALDEDPAILLTPRETEVLAKAAEGFTNKQIARALGISLHTVKFHLESLMRKMGTASRTDAVSKALRLRLLDAAPF